MSDYRHIEDAYPKSGNMFSSFFFKWVKDTLGLYKQVIIITDAGEECDDEVAITLAALVAPKLKWVIFDVVFTDRDHAKQIRMIEDILGDKKTNIKLRSLEDFITNGVHMIKKTQTIVLQIGPIHRKFIGNALYKQLESRINEWNGKYTYVLLGLLGTLNSKADAADAVALFMKNSIHNHLVDTKRGTGAFNFSLKQLDAVLACSGKQILMDLVTRVGFRNTVGRASPDGGQFVAGLIAEPEGANYKTMKTIGEYIQIEEIFSYKLHPDDIDKQITNVVNQYVRALQENKTGKIPLILDGDIVLDSTKPVGENGMHPPINPPLTLTRIKEGYAYILRRLHLTFGVPIDLFVSGSAGEWGKQWDNAEMSGFKATYSSSTESIEQSMKDAYSRWLKGLSVHPETELTPAYDVVGLMFVILLLNNKHSIYFNTEPGKDDNKISIQTLQEIRLQPDTMGDFFGSRVS